MFYLFFILFFSVLSADSYDALLQEHVSRGVLKGISTTLVDYGSWALDPLHQVAMEDLQSTDPESLAEVDKMAFWINAYNLLTIDLIIREKEAESIRNIGGWFRSPWKSYSWSIFGKSYTLDAIEHSILRRMDEPRVHMAIVCASLSCPNLRSEAYRGERLDRQLEEQTRVFLANEAKGATERSSRLTVSKIFSWFEEDFGGRLGVVQFVRNYRPDIPTQDKYETLSYNWDLNGAW